MQEGQRRKGKNVNDFSGSELRLMYALINELVLDSTQPPCVHELKDKVKAMSLNYEETKTIECESCGRLFHLLENGNVPGYADFCSLCNSEHFDANQ